MMTKNKNQESENDLPAGLAAPARRALDGAGIVNLEQFTKLTEAEVMQLHGRGSKAIGLIRSALATKAKCPTKSKIDNPQVSDQGEIKSGTT